MTKLTFLLAVGVAAFINPCFAQDSSKAGMEVEIKNITITGTIKNFDEFVSFVAPDTSYIQLVAVPADGKLKITAHHGLRAFDSNLPKLPIPRKTAFSFKISKIPAGKYFIAAQNLNPDAVTSHGLIYWQSPLFVTDEGKPFIIVISTDAKSPVTINAGNLTLVTETR